MGVGKHGGFGNTAGSKDKSSNQKSSIEKNAEAMKDEYPYSSAGYFGKEGSSSKVRIIKSDNPLGSALDFFRKIAKGGKVEKMDNKKVRKRILDDGTVIVFRIITKTPNSPAVNIKIVNPKSKFKTQKIHFIKK